MQQTTCDGVTVLAPSGRIDTTTTPGVEAIVTSPLDAVNGFAGDAAQGDDITVLALRCRGR